MTAEWVNTIGLMLDIIGVSILSYGLYSGVEQAIERGVSRLASEVDDDNLKLPAVTERLKHWRLQKIGLPIVVLGFVLQIVATWMQ